MLKKSVFLSTVILVSIVLFSTAPLLKTSSEGVETGETLICDNSASAYYSLFGIDKPAPNSLCQTPDNKVFLKEVFSYLAQREKSPPVSVT